MSVCEGLPMPMRRSRVDISREATVEDVSSAYGLAKVVSLFSPFHWNPSWSRKNSLNAGSFFNSLSFFGDVGGLLDSSEDFLLCGDGDDGCARHICASSPSICRRPFLILELSREEMLSNPTDRRDSILPASVGVVRCTMIDPQESHQEFPNRLFLGWILHSNSRSPQTPEL